MIRLRTDAWTNGLKKYIEIRKLKSYRQTPNVSRALVGNKFVDHPNVVCSNCIFILDLTPGFNGSGKGNYKTRRETFRCWDLVWLILEVWRYGWTSVQLALTAITGTIILVPYIHIEPLELIWRSSIHWFHLRMSDHLMTSSNWNIFRVTGHLYGDFLGHRWILRTKASDAELWYLLWYGLYKGLSKQS